MIADVAHRTIPINGAGDVHDATEPRIAITKPVLGRDHSCFCDPPVAGVGPQLRPLITAVGYEIEILAVRDGGRVNEKWPQIHFELRTLVVVSGSTVPRADRYTTAGKRDHLTIT